MSSLSEALWDDALGQAASQGDAAPWAQTTAWGDVV